MSYNLTLLQSGLEEYLHKLEQEKAELESQLKQQTHKVKMLQEELDDAHKVNIPFIFQ